MKLIALIAATLIAAPALADTVTLTCDAKSNFDGHVRHLTLNLNEAEGTVTWHNAGWPGPPQVDHAIFAPNAVSYSSGPQQITVDRSTLQFHSVITSDDTEDGTCVLQRADPNRQF